MEPLRSSVSSSRNYKVFRRNVKNLRNGCGKPEVSHLNEELNFCKIKLRMCPIIMKTIITLLRKLFHSKFQLRGLLASNSNHLWKTFIETFCIRIHKLMHKHENIDCTSLHLKQTIK